MYVSMYVCICMYLCMYIYKAMSNEMRICRLLRFLDMCKPRKCMYMYVYCMHMNVGMYMYTICVLYCLVLLNSMDFLKRFLLRSSLEC